MGKRRVFMWVFLAVQLLFVIYGAAVVAGVGAEGEAASAEAGVGAVFILLAFWLLVDLLLGVGYAVYRMARVRS